MQDFLGELPSIWDETRYVSGYPGKDVVLARRSGNVWYVAGINGTDEPNTLNMDLSFISGTQVTILADTAKKPWDIRKVRTIPTKMECQPRGGFVIVIK